MKRIPLTQNRIALVDDQDFLRLSEFKWFTLKRRNTCYAATFTGMWDSKRRRGRILLLMHRVILRLPAGRQPCVDHMNGNGLDNRRKNLRVASMSQNLANSKQRWANNTSGYKGVSFHKRGHMWTAQITVNYKKIHLGCFQSPEEASGAYRQAAKKFFGQFSRF